MLTLSSHSIAQTRILVSKFGNNRNNGVATPVLYSKPPSKTSPQTFSPNGDAHQQSAANTSVLLRAEAALRRTDGRAHGWVDGSVPHAGTDWDPRLPHPTPCPHPEPSALPSPGPRK